MVATVKVQEVTGASATYTNLANNGIRLMTIDAATLDPAQTTNPVIIPAGATSGYKSGAFNYSFWKSVCLNFTGAGTEIITNIKHYSNGDITGTWTFGTNGQMQRGRKDVAGNKGTVDQGCPAANYAQSGFGNGAVGTSGAPIADSVDGHPYYNGGGNDGVADLNSDTSGSPALVDGTGATPIGAGFTCKMLVLQVKVEYTATQGTQTARTLTWQYDES